MHLHLYKLIFLVLFVMLILLSFCLAVQSNWDEIVQSFDDMNLKEDLLRGIYGYG